MTTFLERQFLIKSFTKTTNCFSKFSCLDSKVFTVFDRLINMKTKLLQAQLGLFNLSADKAPDLDSWQKFLSELDYQLYDFEQQNLNLKSSVHYLQSYAITSSKNTVLGELVGGITHEINNPLSVIQLRSDQLLEMTESDDIKKQFFVKSLKSIDQTVKKISEIISELYSPADCAD